MLWWIVNEGIKRMATKRRLSGLLIFTALILFIILVMQPWQVIHFKEHIDLLFPGGLVALKERNLLFISQILMLLVIIPVYILTFIFSWIYRYDNPKGKYDPDLVDSSLAEVIWWGFPLIITLIIGVITWIHTYELDPFRPIKSDKKEMIVQVVALQWKWLFIYPEENIASVNFFQIPVNTPIHFEITSDAPMNSFWIPGLGGQIYAMPKMKTELWLIADDADDFRGSSANISGEGFSGMHFIARSSSEEDYKKWLDEAKKAPASLDWKSYEKLAAPSENNPVELFQLKDSNLFNQVIMKFMTPPKSE